MLQTFLFKKDKSLQTDISRAEMLAAIHDKDCLLWVDLESPSEFESECLVEMFNFHPLAVEDCFSDHSQPKVDDYEEYLFLVTHAVTMKTNEETSREELGTLELDIFFGKNYVVTVHKIPIKPVAQVRELIRKKPDRFAGKGTDFLVHAVLDNLVDSYQPLLNQYEDRIDNLEKEIFNNPPADFISTVMQTKEDIFYLRRIVSPQRDTVNYLTRVPTSFIRQSHMIYFRDIFDHLQRIHGIAEGFHENLSSILQAYFSYSSHKLNEVVKHLTVLATLTMPALIIGGIYGMNFTNMPELDWRFGYPFSIALAIGSSLAMLVWMKFKKWI
ncbi:MAG: magnesium/cobalt transporter CorA [Candidatus Omnitrophica bacterium]|nr:magnesium/cobalt transporter CorA [Candidatus Omnitrophota bacterium]